MEQLGGLAAAYSGVRWRVRSSLHLEVLEAMQVMCSESPIETRWFYSPEVSKILGQNCFADLIRSQ